jgi:hypothetical protein
MWGLKSRIYVLPKVSGRPSRKRPRETPHLGEFRQRRSVSVYVNVFISTFSERSCRRQSRDVQLALPPVPIGIAWSSGLLRFRVSQSLGDFPFHVRPPEIRYFPDRHRGELQESVTRRTEPIVRVHDGPERVRHFCRLFWNDLMLPKSNSVQFCRGPRT